LPTIFNIIGPRKTLLRDIHVSFQVVLPINKATIITVPDRVTGKVGGKKLPNLRRIMVQ
jgi:hypothetical protein